MSLKLLLDSFEAIRRVKTTATLRLEMERFSRRMGFERFAYALRASAPLPSPQNVIVTGYPEEWRQRYVAQGYFRIDPIVRHCEHSTLPATWDERSFHDEKSQEFWNEAQAFGLWSGLSFAVHEQPGVAGIFSLSRDRKLDLPSQELAALAGRAQIFASVLHDAMVRISFPGLLSPVKVDLTQRERECLKWAAEGKTAREISGILAIAERTVIFHLNNATQKLGAANKTQAVVRALSLNLLF